MNTIEAFLKRAGEIGAEGVRRQKKIILNSMQPELVNTLRRVSEIKNLLYRQRPAALRDIFVDPQLCIDESAVATADVFNAFLNNQRIVIRGSAGLGKSVLLKHFCLRHIDNKESCVPLFLELRKLDGAASKDLVTALHETFSQGPDGLTEDELRQELKLRTFSVLLDGFDEVGPDAYRDVEAAILKFSIDFPGCPLIVTGRSDRVFYSWEQFLVYDISPMTQDATIELISKLEYDPDLKKSFISEAIPKLFSNKDRSFVQTPLLAILMLLTYELFAEVPDKMHLFYAHAFETLLRGHDVTKAQFRRPLKSMLPEEEFKRLFAAFCAATYSNRKYEFSFDEIELYIKQAIAACCLTASVREVIDDLVMSVCVMQYESLQYSFVHRSFQEYFTAVYLRESPLSVVSDFLESGYHPARESVIPMLVGMDRDRLEKEWCLPALDKLSSIVSGDTRAVRAERTLRDLWGRYRFGFSGKIISAIYPPQAIDYRLFSALEIIYPNKGNGLWWIDDWDITTRRARKIVKAVRNGELSRELVSLTKEGRELDPIPSRLPHVDVSVDLSQMDMPKLERFDFVRLADRYLAHLDSVSTEVRARVDRRDQFARSLFVSK